MACYKGVDGIIKVGANAVGQMTSFTVDEETELLECTAMGDTARSRVASFQSWEVAAEFFWDPDDTGQTAITNGASVSLSLYFEGEAAGDTEWTGDAIVTNLSINPTFDGLITATATFISNGALTKGTVST